MTEYTELKPLLEACRAENCDGPREFRKAVEALFDVCTVETISALIAENERLKTLRSTTERDLAQELEVWRNGPSCWSCGDTGDVHDIVGEWRGQCDCNAAKLINAASELDQLKAENEALRKDQTDWQAECLKRGFEYVRESDDHYVLADVPEMADLLGSMLGVEVRSKENDAYEEANSQLNERIEGLINTIHSQESMRKDAERWRFVRNPTATGSPFAVWSERTNLFLGKFADEAIDAAMANGEQS
ncbi:hypothetical protein P5706_21340 [Pseudomonas sp. ChxA]|uniref:hypothetical protein n=1 Tax=Pseudomonas sp. ChxA TaxID=3035473 RepID=UPI0025561136|nr:hypothetical protein [Pseudomonas sp. ChxA]MDL2186738.1 hypothetical protein [Pseudomonas sp. ChxA]